MFKNFLSIFLQENCPLCERASTEDVCSYCQKQLKSCQLKQPQQFWKGDLPLFVWGEYDGKLKQAIAALKYDQNPQIGELLGMWLGETWQNYSLINPKKSPSIIPIPLHSSKEKRRGFNQSNIIAKGFCQVTKYPLIPKGLKRIRATKAMFGLTVAERKQNIQRVFCVGKSLNPSKPVLLLDDIYTTGTTVREASKVLRRQGIKVLGIIALATPRRII